MKTTLLFSLLLAVCAPALAADAPAPSNRYASTIAPAERFDSGVLAVERHGSRGRAVILIPGLASGAWAWQGVLRDLASDNTVYVVTLPGFDGRPTLPGNALDAVRASLRTLIASRKLDHPVLIGHSLGATLAIAVAEDMPGALGGVVAIDGLPVFPGTESVPLEQRAALAAGMAARMAATKPEAFAAQQQAYMRTVGVLDMAVADQLAQLSARSDPGAVARYVGEVLALDLRPGLAAIDAPVLAIVPFFDQDPGAAASSPQAKAAYYQSLLAGTRKLEVLPVDGSRHFVMFDQPALLDAALRRFLRSL